ncbi:hypothetical protein ACLMJK_000478 [Lecanora helva]
MTIQNMRRVILLIVLLSAVNAQITLPTVTGCVGNPAGTATFTTDLSIATGSERIVAGDFWNQLGAVWVLSTDTEGIEFSQPGIPGYGAGFGGGGPPAAAESALVLDPSKTAWSLSVPTSSLGGEWDINFQAAAPTASTATATTSQDSPAGSSTDAAVSSPSTSPAVTVAKRYVPAQPSSSDSRAVPTSTSIVPLPNRPQKPLPFGAKFRRQATSGQFHLIIKGSYPCISPAASTTASGGSPAIASQCVNNQISTDVSAWTTYEAKSYMSSLLSAAAPHPTAPQVNGASLIHSDVNPPGAMCTYNAQCEGVSCNGVKDDTSGSVVSVQRYLAYNAVANFNNYLYTLYDALFDAGTLNGLLDDKIVTTYFTNPSPDATWEQILGIFTPLIGMFGAMLGPFSGGASAVVSSIGGIVGAIGAGGIASSIPPVADKRFDEVATVTDFVGQYLNATVVGIAAAYDSIIGKDSAAVLWAGSDLGDTDLHKEGYFGPGNWVDSNYTQGLTQNLYTSLSKIFTYKAVNFAWIDSGVFIMYVPYGKPIADVNGKAQTGGIDASFCQNSLKDKTNLGSLTICDAPGPGMARIFNAGTVNGAGDLDPTSPQGWDSGEAGIDVAGAIRGSINSWAAGDFAYDASNPYNDALKGGDALSADQLSSLAKFQASEETAGLFNIPVCQMFDLRFFPPASGNSCSACHNSVGGTPGSTKKFGDNVNDIVKKVLQGPPNTISCGGYYGNSCSNQCPSNVYNGKSF